MTFDLLDQPTVAITAAPTATAAAVGFRRLAAGRFRRLAAEKPLLPGSRHGRLGCWLLHACSHKSAAVRHQALELEPELPVWQRLRPGRPPLHLNLMTVQRTPLGRPSWLGLRAAAWRAAATHCMCRESSNIYGRPERQQQQEPPGHQSVLVLFLCNVLH